MRPLKHLLLLLFCTLGYTYTHAQMIEDPTTWKYEAKKKGANLYQLTYHLELKSGWHIWSLHPGGDGYQIVPSFTADSNPKVKSIGKLKEAGKSVTTTMVGIDGKVTYLTGSVDYTQDITVSGPTKLTGKHTYQVCNDSMCLPPKDKDFTFELK